MPLDVEAARKQFPALSATDQIYFDNAYVFVYSFSQPVLTIL